MAAKADYSETGALSIPKLCEYLGISRETVYKEIRAGRLRTYTVGARRFARRQAADDWMRDREAETATAEQAA